MPQTLAWGAAVFVFLTGLAVRFPEPWLIVGARFALVHVAVALTLGAAAALGLAGRRRAVALGALAVAGVSGALPVFVEAARDYGALKTAAHVAAGLAYAACFVPARGRRLAPAAAPAVLVMVIAGALAAVPHRRAERPAPPGAFQPSDARTLTGGTLEAGVINNSGLCADCHPAITREWRESMHGAADLEDPFYMPAHDLMDEHYGKLEPGRYCSACHNPGMLLSGAMVTPPGPLPKPMRAAMAVPEAIRDEGVSCLACHAQLGSDLRGNGSYLLSHPQEAWHFFGGRAALLAERTAIESRPDWHAAAMRPANLDRAEFCATCHTQTVDERLNGFGFVKIRSEYEDWFGEYTGGKGHEGGALRCQDCHMPLVEGFDPANRQGKHRSHRFLGAHTALPFVLGYDTQLELTRQWLRGEYMPEELAGRWPAGPLVAVHVEGAYREGGGSLAVALTNVKVGHSFPAGTITFADVWVEVAVKDRDGEVVFSDGALAADGTHQASFRLFGTLVDERGERLTMAQTFQAVGMGERHTIMPGYVDRFAYAFTSAAPRPWRAEAKLHYRKIAPRFQKFAMPDRPARLPVVTMNAAAGEFAAPAPALIRAR